MTVNEPEYKYINKDMRECLLNKDICLEIIHDIAIDYDGYRDAKNLMDLRKMPEWRNRQTLGT